MEYLLNRYRNLTVLLLAILAQLVLLAYQVKSNGEVRLIRVWAVTAVTPLARALEVGRSSLSHFFSDYFVLLDVREENKRMKKELDRINMDNQYLRTELDTADRAKSLAIFQSHSPSKTVAAHIIGNTTGSKTVIIDRGSTSGVQKEMAVITPDGIVGKVVDVYPTASFVLLATDPSFAAGVISQKNRVHGTLKGQGGAKVIVDYVQNEEHVEQGEWFYTSGDDGVFPKGLPVGEATSVHPGKSKQEIILSPSGFQNGLEEVLIIIEGVHAPIPELPLPNQQIHVQAPPTVDPGETVAPTGSSAASGSSGASGASGAAAPPTGPLSDADRIIDRYRQIGDAEKHVWGQRGKGPPDFNIPLDPKPGEVPKLKQNP
jgi:rod shape-determining protein MreC